MFLMLPLCVVLAIVQTTAWYQTGVQGAVVPKPKHDTSLSKAQGVTFALDTSRDRGLKSDNALLSNLSKREVTNEQWSAFVQKGQGLLGFMCTDAEGATEMLQKSSPAGNTISSQSKWTDYADLKKYGWDKADTNYMVDFATSVPIVKALQSLQLSTEAAPDGPNQGVYWEHEHASTIGSTTYPATEADYHEIYNSKQGAIMAWGNHGPAFKMQEKYGASQHPPLVPLRQWSDIVFLEWQTLCTQSGDQTAIKGLHYIFRLLISNEDSQALVSMALANKGAQLAHWPGTSFLQDSDEFKALLGSPNGAGVGWMLINHKAQLGRKTVSQISVFRHDGEAETAAPTMLFWLKDNGDEADAGPSEGDNGTGDSNEGLGAGTERPGG